MDNSSQITPVATNGTLMTPEQAYQYLQSPAVGMNLEEIHAFERRGYKVEYVAWVVTSEFDKKERPSKEKVHLALTMAFPEMYNLVTPTDFTDVGNSEIVERRNRGKMLFCDALGWLVYDEHSGRWEVNEHAARGKCIEFTDAMLEEAKELYDEEFQKALAEAKTGKVQVSKETINYHKHALNSRGRHAIDNMLSLCKPYMNVKAKDLDANPFDLNTPAGVVDLRTGEIRPHEAKALCTHITNCSPSFDGMDLWLKFIELITCNDAALAKYLQLNAGMSAIGKITVEYAVFAIGCGRNGKSTYYGALSSVLGDYAGAIDSDAIIADNRDKRFAFAGIRGKRFVTCGELEENKKLSTKALKTISSANDKFLIQQKYKDEEEVPRTFHLTMFSNFKPKVDSIDNGTWRRIQVVPFNAVMPSGKQEIKDYAGYLVEHAGGAIMQWIIDGAVEVYKARFNIEQPAAVSTASQEYREAESWIDNFLGDCFEIKPDGNVRAGDVQTLWGIYSRKNNMPARSKAELINAMGERGFTQRTGSHNKKYWDGLILADEGKELLERNK